VPLFRYNAFNKQGKSVAGTLEASSLQNAKDLVRSKDLMPIDVVEISALERGFSLKTLFERSIDTKSIILFTKQLSVLLKSGVPLLQSIELLAGQFEGKMHRILVNVKDEIKSGKAFASALEAYPRVFSKIYVQLVRAGEASGNLEAVLNSLTIYLEKADDIKRRVKKAMSYPLLMLGFSAVVVVVLIAFAVPKMVATFAQVGGDLPASTQFLMDMSDYFRNHYFILVIGLIGFVVLFKYWKSSPAGTFALDKLYLKLPLISYFVKTKVVVNFTKTLGLLLESGVNLAEALDIVCNIINNSVLTRSLKSARDKIIKEGKIAQYLKETNIFPSIAIYMIDTGEQSGKLAEMLIEVGNEYEIQLSELIENLVSKINPAMIILVGGIILFIVMAMYAPMVSMGEGIMGGSDIAF